MKILIDIKGTPTQDSVMVYNEKDDCWEVKKKTIFFKEIHKELQENKETELKIENKLRETEKQLEKLENNISKLANVIKGLVK